MSSTSPSAPGAAIEFLDVCKSYDRKPVLDRASLQIRRGEAMVILGPSGTGKSVALRHINGLTRPDSGKVLVFGEDITGYSEEELVPTRLRVSMLFQGGALFDSMNVYQNVSFPLREHRDLPEGEIAARVGEKLELVGLSGIGKKMPDELSGGMRKRVALARTIVMDPEIILFDEPTTGLDPINARKINELVDELNHRLSATFVVVTHDIVSARAVADRIAFLHDGAFRFVGTFEEAVCSGHPVLSDFFRAQGFPCQPEAAPSARV